MKLLPASLAALCALLVATNAAAQLPQQTPQPASLWKTDAAGTATQIQTGFQCPETIGPFQRQRFKMETVRILHASCMYTSIPLASTMMITLLYPEGRSLRTLFDNRGAGAAQSLESSKPRSTALQFASAYSWLSKAHSGDLPALGQLVPVGVDEFATEIGGWHISIEIMYRADMWAAVSKGLADVSAHLQKTVGAHLSACAAAPALPATGRRITDMKRIDPIASALARHALEKITARANAPVWCAQQPLWLDNKKTYMLSRNIAPSAMPGGLVDQFTALDDGESHYTVSYQNNLFLVVKDGPADISLLQVYDGRPAPSGAGGNAIIHINKADGSTRSPARLLQ